MTLQAPSAADRTTQTLSVARQAFDHGDWSEAERGAREILNADPGSAEASYLLAHVFFHENKPKESLQAFTAAAKLRAPFAADLRAVSLDYVLLGDYDDADHWVLSSLRQDPNAGESWYTLGRIRYTENRFTDAIQSFGKALELMPKSVKAEDNLGLAYEGLNQPDKAIEAYRQALVWQAGEAHPSEQPMINLGILLTDRNQLAEARSLLERAEALAPGDNRVHGALGRLYARSNELPAAQRELEQAVAAEPKNSGLHFQLGQVLHKEGMTERANAELQQAAALERAGRH